MKTFLSLLLLAVVVTTEKIRFDDHEVYSLDVKTIDQLQALRNIENNDGFTFWNTIALNRQVDLMVSPEKQSEFLQIVQELNLNHVLKIENVQTLIDNERPKVHARVFGWTDYFTLEDTYSWLDSIIEANPTILTNYNIGNSFEGRTIRVVKLSHKAGNPAIFVESTVHAREWITTATATWFLNELLTSTDPAIRDLAENIDWYIMPVFNVDGYAYTHRVNRLWRKTRQPHAHLCYGTDANRNFDLHWMENGGASNNPCSETFAGPVAFSEPETVALDAFISSIAADLKIYLAFHSYGQYILFPYGHDVTHSSHHDVLTTVSDRMVIAYAQQFGTAYVAGTFGEALYIGSGTSVDWMYEKHGIPISYTLEFRDSRNGNYGFILPANQIIDNCLETKDALIEMVAETRRLGYL